MTGRPHGLLAENLRRRRRAAQFSLGALADQSGVAKGTISTIENGQANPTIDTIAALADALGSTVVELLTETADPMAVYVSGDAARERFGPVEGRLLHRFAPTGPVEIFDILVPAGGRRRSRPHAYGVYEHLWVADGRLEAGPAEAPVTLAAGDYLCFAAWSPHSYHALDGPARVAMLLSYVRAPTGIDVLRHLS